ncbi:mammalian ependymin-related protein 1-like [Pomacea canaliculata]|uniref:mammalian ependymin-related protein 1-like n=1 Tax=Pomacea canaliculata TaxID=400727 RepID=UPI000D73A9EC|nr:mammalian ependymin-related protein 1-like [Pomacea canaliculata]XP_025103314.1 mammalian ependymin-related protein 1-like [Pomacea canaliculata]
MILQMDGVVHFGIILVVVLGLTAGKTQNCCFPDQWQGLLSSIAEAQGNLEQAVSYLSYDYTNRRWASFTNLTDSTGSQVYSYETLVLYSGPNSGMLYNFDLKTRECSVQKMSGPFTKMCIPDIAQKVGDLTLGAATESLPVTVYSITGQNGTYQSFTTVTRQLCLPVSEVNTEDFEGDVYMTVSGFADIQLGITQPSVFDVPPECKGAKPLHSDKMFPEFSAKASFTRRFFYL